MAFKSCFYSNFDELVERFSLDTPPQSPLLSDDELTMDEECASLKVHVCLSVYLSVCLFCVVIVFVYISSLFSLTPPIRLYFLFIPALPQFYPSLHIFSF